MNINQAVDFLQAQITMQKIIGINDPMQKVNIDALSTVCNYVKENERQKSMKKIGDSLCK